MSIAKVPSRDRYSIIRFYSPAMKKDREVIKTGVTFEEAQKHCNDPKTAKAGEYFDGYMREDR